jgi:serine/threonine-protein kinase
MSPEQAGFKVTDRRSDIFSAGVVLAHLLLGHNIFKGTTSKESLQLVTKKNIPDFSKVDPRIDSRLNGILHRALARNLEERYQTADELLYDLEYQIYHSGYGPTNETLGKFMRELFGKCDPQAFFEPRGSTRLLEQTARVATRGSSKTRS